MKLVCLLFLLLLSSTVALAEGRPFRTTLDSINPTELRTLLQQDQVDDQPTRRRTVRRIKTLSFSLHLPNLGNVSLWFDERLAKTWRASHDYKIHLLHGRVKLRARGSSAKPRAKARTTLPATASFYQVSPGRWRGVLFFSHRETATGEGREVELIAEVSNGELSRLSRIKQVPSAVPAWAGKTCGTEGATLAAGGEDGSGNDGSGGTQMSGAGLQTVDLATDADKEFVDTYGGASSANAQIATYIDQANTVKNYNDQLALNINIVSQEARTSYSTYPQSYTDPETLLEQFQGLRSGLEGDFDAAHLFTGKDMDGGVIGLAYSQACGHGYYGVVCSCPAYAMAWSEDFNSALTSTIVAHEIGHNLSATHTDPSTEGGIMSPALGLPAPSTFHSSSVDEITGYVSLYGSCLAAADGDDSSSSGDSSSDDSSSGDTSSTPGGGNSGGGGVDDDVPVGFTASFKKSQLALNITFSAERTGCVVEVFGASKASLLGDADKRKHLLSFSVPDGNNTVSITVNIPSVKKQGAKVYLGAGAECAEESFAETGKALKVGSTSVRHGVTTVPAFLKRLGTALEALVN